MRPAKDYPRVAIVADRNENSLAVRQVEALQGVLEVEGVYRFVGQVDAGSFKSSMLLRIHRVMHIITHPTQSDTSERLQVLQT